MFSVFKKPVEKAAPIIEQNKLALTRLLEISGIPHEKTLDQILKDIEKNGLIKN